ELHGPIDQGYPLLGASVHGPVRAQNISASDGRERHAGEVGRVRSGEVDHRRRNVEGAHGGLVVAAGLAVGQGGDEGHAQSLVVALARVASEVVLVEALALRSMDDPRNARTARAAAYRRRELGDLLIHEGHLAVVGRRLSAAEVDTGVVEVALVRVEQM